MCCTRKIAKNSPSEHHRTSLSGCIFATKACFDNRKKLVKQQYLLHMSAQYANLDPVAAEIGLGIWAPQQISTDFASCLRFAATSLTGGQPNFAWCLAVSWASTFYIHFQGFLPQGKLAQCKIHFTSKGLAFSYIGSVSARHSMSGRQPNFAAWYKEWNYGTFAEGATYIRLGGHHVWQIVVTCLHFYYYDDIIAINIQIWKKRVWWPVSCFSG